MQEHPQPKQAVGTIELKFTSLEGPVEFTIDREKKIFWLTSEKTNFERQQMPWKSLWDSGQEEKQDRIAASLSDEEFRNLFIQQMKLYGYEYRKNGNT